MTYQETIDYLFSRLPMYHRIGAAAYKDNLDNTLKMCRLLDNPEKKFPSVHVAGTNGKGSVANMTASILQEAGYKTGLFTSPHLRDFRERIRINGEPISEQFVIDFVEKHQQRFEAIEASFFEFTFALAADYFAAEQVDIAVMEVGMGGRLDSTNVVNSVISVITNIAFDHTQFLGNTLEKIAGEKAGIIKPEVPVVIGETQEEIMDVFLEKAMDNETSVIFADNRYVARFNSNGRLDVNLEGDSFLANLKLPLRGIYQECNVPTTLQTIETLKEEGWKIKKSDIKKGLENVVQNTGFIGRWQILNEKPLIVCDTAHNPAGLSLTTKQLKSIPKKNLHIVIGVVNDKDIEHILPLFPKEAIYYFCKANIPRGLDAKILQENAEKFELKGSCYESVKVAYDAARQNAGIEDVIYVGGSTFTVAEVI
ncbi:MAG: bifunctional folylpolyglutamate synthase/dihydrofolate synthase [Bacteroidales bacterium]|nr:bifunctional folylpolyglutamate synthase/dihydrofolate synthase [Bacteroidales bacterium]